MDGNFLNQLFIVYDVVVLCREVREAGVLVGRRLRGVYGQWLLYSLCVVGGCVCVW